MQDVKQPVACLVEYNDGTHGVVLALGGLVNEYLAAFRLKGGAGIDSTLCYVPPENSNNFSMLVHGIVQMFGTGKPPYPVERTLLTTGALSALMESGYRGHERIVTPELALRVHGPSTVVLCTRSRVLMQSELEKLTGPKPVVQKIAGGFGSVAGPLFSRIGYPLFCDMPANRIIKWGAREVSLFRENSNDARALSFDHQGRLLACERGRVTRTEKDAKITRTIANVRVVSHLLPINRNYMQPILAAGRWGRMRSQPMGRFAGAEFMRQLMRVG